MTRVELAANGRAGYHWRPRHHQPTGNPLDLTDTELAITQLLVAGRTRPEIAAALHFHRKTIVYHAAKLYERFGVANVVEFTRFWIYAVEVPMRSEEIV